MDAQDRYLASLAQNRTEKEQEQILNARKEPEMSTTTYSAWVSDSEGNRLYTTSGHAARQEALDQAWKRHPSARTVASGKGASGWEDVQFQSAVARRIETGAPEPTGEAWDGSEIEQSWEMTSEAAERNVKVSAFANSAQGRTTTRCDNPQCGADLEGDFTRRYCSEACQETANAEEVAGKILRLARDEALPVAFADCEALVSAGLLALAEKEAALQREAYGNADTSHIRHATRAACLREMSLAVSLGQFRTAECNERAIVAAHRDAAGFNPSKAGGEARSRALSPAKRKKIATKAARARWAAKKGE